MLRYCRADQPQCAQNLQYDKGLRGLPHGKTWQLDDTGQVRNVQDGVEAFEAWPDPSRPLGKWILAVQRPRARYVGLFQYNRSSRRSTVQCVPRPIYRAQRGHR